MLARELGDMSADYSSYPQEVQYFIDFLPFNYTMVAAGQKERRMSNAYILCGTLFGGLAVSYVRRLYLDAKCPIWRYRWKNKGKYVLRRPARP